MMRMEGVPVYRLGMKNKAGFTLTEIMVASLILLSVSVAFTAAMLAALRTSNMTSSYYLATSIARNRIQRAHNVDFDYLATALPETLRKVDELGNATTSGTYRRTTTVSYITPNQVEITVQVYFPSGRTVLSAEPVEVRTMFTKGM